MNKLNFLLLFVMPISLSAQQKLEFIEEKIDFSINNDLFSVNGIYYFANNSEQAINRTILFPFSKNTDSTVFKRVYNLTYSKNLSFRELNKAIAFKIFILPKDTVKINIAYIQKAVKENVYILESTRHWGQALQKAHYSLTFAPSVQIDSLSLKPDTLINHVYHWTKTNFYPNENFKVWLK